MKMIYFEPTILDNLRTLWKFHLRKHGEAPDKIQMSKKQLTEYRRAITGNPDSQLKVYRGAKICVK